MRVFFWYGLYEDFLFSERRRQRAEEEYIPPNPVPTETRSRTDSVSSSVSYQRNTGNKKDQQT